MEYNRYLNGATIKTHLQGALCLVNNIQHNTAQKNYTDIGYIVGASRVKIIVEKINVVVSLIGYPVNLNIPKSDLCNVFKIPKREFDLYGFKSCIDSVNVSEITKYANK